MKQDLTRRILARLAVEAPHLPEAARTALAEKLTGILPKLHQNLAEWANGQPFTETAVRGKYTLALVLALRRDRDVPSALLDLDAYARDEGTEYRLWRLRA